MAFYLVFFLKYIYLVAVSNLPSSFKPVEKFFEKLDIHRFTKPNRSRTAFVQYQDEADAKKATALIQGRRLESRIITASYKRTVPIEFCYKSDTAESKFSLSFVVKKTKS
ncbi:hypothetical protein BY458DRAFT_513793 [Sporodiniella umbellata]|nr:hypothetical protein BY458DRAFT_513793 [Sporodiniella umbellata]